MLSRCFVLPLRLCTFALKIEAHEWIRHAQSESFVRHELLGLLGLLVIEIGLYNIPAMDNVRRTN
jgi:hypothetical protein